MIIGKLHQDHEQLFMDSIEQIRHNLQEQMQKWDIAKVGCVSTLEGTTLFLPPPGPSVLRQENTFSSPCTSHHRRIPTKMGTETSTTGFSGPHPCKLLQERNCEQHHGRGDSGTKVKLSHSLLPLPRRVTFLVQFYYIYVSRSQSGQYCCPLAS